MFSFMNDKSKADIKVLEFFDKNTEVGARSYFQATVDISQYIDDADNYMIVGEAFYLLKNSASETGPFIEKWFSCLSDFHKASTGYVYEVLVFPLDCSFYNSGSRRYLQYTLMNITTAPRKAKLRVMLMRIGDVINVI